MWEEQPIHALLTDSRLLPPGEIDTVQCTYFVLPPVQGCPKQGHFPEDDSSRWDLMLASVQFLLAGDVELFASLPEIHP